MRASAATEQNITALGRLMFHKSTKKVLHRSAIVVKDPNTNLWTCPPTHWVVPTSTGTQQEKIKALYSHLPELSYDVTPTLLTSVEVTHSRRTKK